MVPQQKQGFLSAIREAPDDDSHRLPFADWLEDKDDPRGEFIRIQTYLSRMAPDDARRTALEQRENALLKAHGRQWAEEDLLNYCPLDNEYQLVNPSVYDNAETKTVKDLYQIHYPVFERGFVTRASLPTTMLNNDWEHSPIRRLLNETTVRDIYVVQYQSPTRTVEGPLTMVPGPKLSQYINAILPNGITERACLSRLRTLDLSASEVSINDEFAMRLAATPELTNLLLFKAGARAITDAGVEALLRAPHLQHTVIDISLLLDSSRVSYANREELHKHNIDAARWQQEQLNAGSISSGAGVYIDGDRRTAPVFGTANVKQVS